MGHLDLEDIASGMDPLERDLREGCGAPRLEPAREVVRPEPQDDPREQASTTRDEPAARTPVLDATAARVATPDDEVGLTARHRGDEERQGGGVMGPVRVHLDDAARTALQGDPEPVQVGPAEALLCGTVADPDPRIPRGQIIGDG